MRTLALEDHTSIFVSWDRRNLVGEVLIQQRS